MPENIIRCIDLGKDPHAFEKISARDSSLPASHTVQRWIDQLAPPPPLVTLRPSNNTFRSSKEARILRPHLSTYTRIRKVSSPALIKTKLRRSNRLQRQQPASFMPPSTDSSRLPHGSRDKKHRPSAHDTPRTIQTRGRAMRGKDSGSNKENQEEDLQSHFDQSGIGDPVKKLRDLSHGPSSAEVQSSRMATSSKEDMTQRSRTTSPKKQPSGISGSGSSPAKSSKINAVKFAHLKHLTPAVHFLSLRVGLTLTEPPPPKEPRNKEKEQVDSQARSFACKQAAHQLWTDYIRPAVNKTEVIPEEFKSRLEAAVDTPSKSRLPPALLNFGATFNAADLDLVWLEVSDIVNQAEELRYSDVPESHWLAAVVHPMLRLLRRLREFNSETTRLECLDITTIPINPGDLCPYSTEDIFKDLDKRIDCAIGLKLSASDRGILERGVYQRDGVSSINQTTSFMNFIPMFGNLEIKRPNTGRDPLVQLAAWIAAEFNKRRIEGYGMERPVLAIAVDGDRWVLFVVYAAILQHGFSLNFVGPIDMGTTLSVEGTFKILNVLIAISRYGYREFRTRFLNEVLAIYKP